MLPDVAIDPSNRDRLAQIVESVSQASDRGDIQALLHRATVALGAERSFFASINGAGASYAFVLDCDSAWWHRYRAVCSLERNPWIVYASRHSTPVRATQLDSFLGEEQRALSIALQTGFASTVLIPAPSGRADERVGLLCLGHSAAGCFEDAKFAKLQFFAKSLAMELLEWWTVYERRQLAQGTRLSDADIRLLARHCVGLSSKQIANEMHVSCESINSRFQRIIARLGVRNRRAAARVAIECGLIIV